MHAVCTAAACKETKLTRTRSMSYPRACPVEPPEHTVRVEVLLDRATTRVACQAGLALLAQPLAYGDPHSPPAFRPESPTEVFYGTRRGHDDRDRGRGARARARGGPAAATGSRCRA